MHGWVVIGIVIGVIAFVAGLIWFAIHLDRRYEATQKAAAERQKHADHVAWSKKFMDYLVAFERGATPETAKALDSERLNRSYHAAVVAYPNDARRFDLALDQASKIVRHEGTRTLLRGYVQKWTDQHDLHALADYARTLTRSETERNEFEAEFGLSMETAVAELVPAYQATLADYMARAPHDATVLAKFRQLIKNHYGSALAGYVGKLSYPAEWDFWLTSVVAHPVLEAFNNPLPYYVLSDHYRDLGAIGRLAGQGLAETTDEAAMKLKLVLAYCQTDSHARNDLGNTLYAHVVEAVAVYNLRFENAPKTI